MYLPDVPDIYIGDDAVERVYLGDELVWPTDYESKYFTLSIVSGGTLNIARTRNVNYTDSYRKGAVVDYSINGGAWETSVPAGGPYPTASEPSGLTVNAGDIILFRGDYTGRDSDMGQYYTLTFYGSTCSFNAYGNINSLIFGDAFSAHTGETVFDAYAHLFQNSMLLSAKHLVTPTGQYQSWAFFGTFYGCTSLTEPPVIRCTEVYDSAAFTETFCDCTNLQKIIIPYLDPVPSEGFARWALNVPNTGTFVKKAGVQYPTYTPPNWAQNGIPSGWTVVEA